MDYEKAYKHALDLAKQVHDTTISKQQKENIEIIFPELAESEDEQVKKEILSVIRQFDDNSTLCGKKYDYRKWIAWLGKQGQKPAPDIEIPFGAKDSELQEATYLIPEGFHAEIKDDEVLIKKGKQKPTQWNISDFRTWQHIVSDVLTKHQGIGQYLDGGEYRKIAKYMQEEWSKRLCLNQKPTWSEEDERMYSIVFEEYKNRQYYSHPNLENRDINGEILDWFKSIKQRIGG